MGGGDSTAARRPARDRLADRVAPRPSRRDLRPTGGASAAGRGPPERCGRGSAAGSPSRRATAAVLLAAAALAGGASAREAAPPTVVAQLRAIGTGAAEMRATVEEVPDAGYRLVVRCETGCPRPVLHREDIANTPLGLFQIWDGDGLLLSTWASGSAYVVRAHLLTPGGVRAVLEAGSRGAPGFRVDGRGRTVVATAERRNGPASGSRETLWRWDGQRFLRVGAGR